MSEPQIKHIVEAILMAAGKPLFGICLGVDPKQGVIVKL